MKKKVWLINLLIIILFILLSCNNSNTSFKNKYTLKASEDDTINIRLGENTRNYSYHIQYFKSNGVDYLANLNHLNNSIEFYDLFTKRLFKQVMIHREGSNAFASIESFIWKGFDSILIFSMLPGKTGIIDTGGRILKTIPHEIKTSTLERGQRPFCIGNNIFLGQIYPAHESNGKLTETAQKKSFINLNVDLISGKCKPSPLTYPEELTGRSVFDMDVQRVLGYNNCFVYHFNLINNLFLTNDHLKFDRVPLETNYKLKILNNSDLNSSINNYLNNKLILDEVKCIYYDEFRECYYITIRKREDQRIKNSSITTKFLYPDCFILILDKKLKHIGEVHFPKDIYLFHMVFITDKGLYISEDNVNNPSFSEDYMRFRLFTLERTKD
jgi:hypothetical protein